MAQNTDLNVSPYYDDFSESKNFHKILFQPSNAIQARELTQLQSILQNQVERFGNHIFEEGALVSGGTITINTVYYAVKVEDTNPNGSGTSSAENYRASSVGKFFKGQTSGVVAKVINSVAATSDGDPLTLYVTYLKTNIDTNSVTSANSTFVDGEELQEVTNSSGTYSDASNNNEFKTISSGSTATGSAATIRGGIIYTRGFFVRVDEQTILLDKYLNSPTYRIGLSVDESFVTSSDDTSLLDNATGTSNENAPGANRLKIALTLVKKSTSGTQDIDNFIELSRVEAGIITKQTEVTEYSTLERTLARRTFDESGDYTVKPFNIELREHLNNNTNNGIFLSSNTSTPGDSSKFVSVVSPGKAFVKGFEIDKPSESLLTLDKARDVDTISSVGVPFELGNHYDVNNVHSIPEFGGRASGNSSIAALGSVALRDTETSSDGTGAGAQIGEARCRGFKKVGTPTYSSNSSTDVSVFRIQLFDVAMYTELTVANDDYEIIVGQKVIGSNSGATGILAVAQDSDGTATKLLLRDVTGNFNTSDVVKLENLVAQSGVAGKTVTAIHTYSTEDVRSISQAAKTSGGVTFTCDTLLTDNQRTLSGTVTCAGSTTTVTGVNTKFTQELRKGDVIVFPSGAARIVAAFDTTTPDTKLTLTANGPNETGRAVRQRAKLKDQEKRTVISPTPRDHLKSITPSQVTVRRQGFLDLGSTDAISVAADENLITEGTNQAQSDVIIALSDDDDGTTSQGLIVNEAQAGVLVIDSNSGGSLTIDGSDSTALAAAGEASCRVKFTFAVTKTSMASDHSVKTLQKSKGVYLDAPDTSKTSIYGTNLNDKQITLGVPDIYRLNAIYESQEKDSSGNQVSATPPVLTIASGFAGNPGDKIVGSSSKAVGRIIKFSGTTLHFYYLTKEKFTTSDTITNEDNTNSSTNSRAVSAVSEKSKDITKNYLLDDGQRDSYYGLGSVIRKDGAPAPSNNILIVFDYFTHSTGSFFTVNSYTGLDFEEIPKYIPNVVDPAGLEPDGVFELSDAIDYRPVCKRLIDPSTALTFSEANDVNICDDVTIQPFSYSATTFDDSTAVVFDLPKSGLTLSASSLERYLPRIDKVSLSSDGHFVVTKGQSADNPSAPLHPTNSMLLHTLYIPPYTPDISKISARSEDHRRFTMRDIGRIQGRVKNLERVTSLNALEQETNLSQIQDADGLDRFKSGFLTDNFRGHNVGDVNHPDYKIGVDRTTGTLRPMHNSRFVSLSLNTSTSANYQKTGDLITLPYTEEAYVNIDKASTTEFVNPYDVVLFNGNVSLSPSRDMWFDTQRLPSVRRVVEGDYDTVLAGVGNALGTVWNNWQTDWTGEPVTTVNEPGVNRPGPGTVANRRRDVVASPRQRVRNPGGRRAEIDLVQER